MIKQTPWFERKFDLNFPVGLFPVIIERLEGTIPRIKAMTKNVGEEVLTRKSNTEWSAKEQVGHLYDLEELWYGRLGDFLSGKEVLTAADLRNTKTREANHNNSAMHELIELFSFERNKLINKIKDADETTASLTALHPRLRTPMRLVDHLFFIAEHDDHHLAKIRGLIRESSIVDGEL
jgi:uncharacterized damage-inducible protein DinB